MEWTLFVEVTLLTTACSHEGCETRLLPYLDINTRLEPSKVLSSASGRNHIFLLVSSADLSHKPFEGEGGQAKPMSYGSRLSKYPAIIDFPLV